MCRSGSTVGRHVSSLSTAKHNRGPRSFPLPPRGLPSSVGRAARCCAPHGAGGPDLDALSKSALFCLTMSTKGCPALPSLKSFPTLAPRCSAAHWPRVVFWSATIRHGAEESWLISGGCCAEWWALKRRAEPASRKRTRASARRALALRCQAGSCPEVSVAPKRAHQGSAKEGWMGVLPSAPAIKSLA